MIPQHYRHTLFFKDEEKAEAADSWIQEHIDLTNYYQAIDCSIVSNGTNTQTPFECVFLTEEYLQQDTEDLILLECQPEALELNNLQYETIIKEATRLAGAGSRLMSPEQVTSEILKHLEHHTQAKWEERDIQSLTRYERHWVCVACRDGEIQAFLFEEANQQLYYCVPAFTKVLGEV